MTKWCAAKGGLAAHNNGLGFIVELVARRNPPDGGGYITIAWWVTTRGQANVKQQTVVLRG
jgi:hypothetical protein